MVGNQPEHEVFDGWENQPGHVVADGWVDRQLQPIYANIIPTRPWPHTRSGCGGIELQSFGYNIGMKILVSMIGGIRFEA